MKDVREETIQRGHMESHPYFINVEHLEIVSLMCYN